MRNDSLLVTDLYQLTMVQSYLDHGLTHSASFELFVRKLPEHRNFLVFSGLESLLEYLEQLRLDATELDWLRKTGRFSDTLLDYLETLRFDGHVDAMREGTVFFPDEPVVRITASLPLAQLIETRLINLLHFQTLIASKAARVRLAAGDRQLVDFGLRRSHGAEAGLLAARASYLAGFDATSNVQAGFAYGIPIVGTMAHSYILAHERESEAFVHYAHSHPAGVVLLIDTYDTEAAASKVVELAPRLASEGIRIQAVRLDSGDLGAHARKVRGILDRGGLHQVRIFASGNLDECRIKSLLDEGAPIDGFGVGTRMNTSSDAPYLDCAYKLQEYDGRARRKLSEHKATWPGRKQVYRHYRDGMIERDIITTLDDTRSTGEPLLQPVMRNGRRLHALPDLDAARAYARQQLQALPVALRQPDMVEEGRPVVEVSQALQNLAKAVDREIRLRMAS